MPRNGESAPEPPPASSRSRSIRTVKKNGCTHKEESAEAPLVDPAPPPKSVQSRKRKSEPIAKSTKHKSDSSAKAVSSKRKRGKAGKSDVGYLENDGREEFNEEVLPEEGEDQIIDDNKEWKAPQFEVKIRGKKEIEDDDEVRFIGKPVPEEEAKEKWPHRYLFKKLKRSAGTEIKNEDKLFTQAGKHYTRAKVDGIEYNLGDDAHVWAGETDPPYICKIIEMYEDVGGDLYFTAQWYYRAKDTVIKDVHEILDQKRVFFSEIKDDNPLGCLLKKLSIKRVKLDMDIKRKLEIIPASSDYWCDMVYLVPNSSFLNLPENVDCGNESSSTISSDVDKNNGSELKVHQRNSAKEKKVVLLDLYSGCGGMSTGLCLGAQMAGLQLETGWAVDMNADACTSLKYNHPETKVRNESAENFLGLMKAWTILCTYFSLVKSTSEDDQIVNPFDLPNGDEAVDGDDNNGDDDDDDGPLDPEVFEVEEVLDIIYGDPKQTMTGNKLHFKVRWKNYGPEEDTWEPIEGLSAAQEKVKEFVAKGFIAKIIPLQGDVDVVCGGPPCQGVSGFNRFRNKEEPLAGEKNSQLDVYMDIVDFLKPKYVLMENVVDLVKFSGGFLGRYALARMLRMNYQTRLGLMAAGAYGLPQYRMRVFLWGALPTEKLPQYPLPTHDVVRRGANPTEFEMNLVAYENGKQPELKKKLFLEDAISDMPNVENSETRDEMPYDQDPKTDFQRFIRSRKEAPGNSSSCCSKKDMLLYDHRPYRCNPDDYERVCAIPKKKGANFRDLPGVLVDEKKKVYWDPNVERVYLKSGKPLVPDYAMSYVRGTSTKPFGRLWWDEIVSTVVTRPEPHNQIIIHPEQDRVLTIRENARLQGFPDYYKLFGDIKQRYVQVGNAVAVPVARALGYALALAYQGLGGVGNEPMFQLPAGFPNLLEPENGSPESSQG